MASALEVRNLVKIYNTGGTCVRAVDDVSLSVAPGEFVVILGASGSGKSTLLHLVAGLDLPTAGTVTIDGHDLFQFSDAERTRFRRRRIGVIFQAYNLLPTLSALDNVALPALLDGQGARAAGARAEMLLTRVGLQNRLRHRPDALSGGEQQRVAVARALMNEPTLLLADEPTGNLDTQRGQEIWRLLAELVEPAAGSAPPGGAGATPGGSGATKPTAEAPPPSAVGQAAARLPAVIAVTHDAAGAAHAHRVLVLKDGRYVGEFDPRAEQRGQDEHHAALVAARYAELAERT
ncbi:MAG TPA: ABC transporter ATP-binding protein [Phycisphaerae bacterium]|nr:ABC transporter ATP-binding protein [Phycisphaerae bacterium]HNU47129.1 ABC transporter ATP-binding protein [Phycisphaerae bacterium]